MQRLVNEVDWDSVEVSKTAQFFLIDVQFGSHQSHNEVYVTAQIFLIYVNFVSC